MYELKVVGFSVNQAIDFLPEAAWSIENLTRISGAARTIDNLPSDDSSNGKYYKYERNSTKTGVKYQSGNVWFQSYYSLYFTIIFKQEMTSLE